MLCDPMWAGTKRSDDEEGSDAEDNMSDASKELDPRKAEDALRECLRNAGVFQFCASADVYGYNVPRAYVFKPKAEYIRQQEPWERYSSELWEGVISAADALREAGMPTSQIELVMTGRTKRVEDICRNAVVKRVWGDEGAFENWYKSAV